MSMYIIDDHPLVRQAIAMLLRRMRPASKVIELDKFSELQAAIIKNGEPELFVLDLLLPGVKGTSAVKDIKTMYANVPLAVISSMPAGEAETTLQAIAQNRAQCGWGPLTVTGHADKSGSDKYNQALSERRAGEVRGYLVSHGVADGVVATQGFGETMPLVDTADGVKEPQNRRATIDLN